MKRYLISILVAILAIGIIFQASCTGSQQQIAELEHKVATLAEQVQELSTKDALTPKVIEKDVEVNSRGIEYLPFYLKVGDRVEGEVSVSHGESIVVGQVRDPYGNVVVQTSHITFRGEYWENSGFPWRFAFIAYTDGEYRLRVFRYVTLGGQSQPSAHLKITCYEDG